MVPPFYTKTLTGAGMWSGVIGRGKTLRLTDREGGANVGVLLYNADLTPSAGTTRSAAVPTPGWSRRSTGRKTIRPPAMTFTATVGNAS